MGLVGREEPLTATRDALDLLGFDEVIISMPPARESRWLHLDLARKVRALGVPVSQVTTRPSAPMNQAPMDETIVPPAGAVSSPRALHGSVCTTTSAIWGIRWRRASSSSLAS
jgi:hypothetical protein